ncbi:uncharacterized protein METZ01_LOCUS87798 [marine metagenome]|uniref:Uncharacterized protein n=1 Tax=marine metagenome TaxID=408172 RepID=A0A381V419_9ZZZZ
MQFHDNVAPANQLTIDIELWKSRPVRVLLEPFSDLGIFKNIHVGKFSAHGA